MSKQKQLWQPISMLPIFTEMVDGMLESSVEQLNNMQLVMDKPHVLDDATMDRIIALYNNQLKDQLLFNKQFARWKKGKLSGAEETEINRLINQTSKLKEVNEEILMLADSIKHSTIDKIMAMDDGELAAAVLTGKINRPDKVK